MSHSRLTEEDPLQFSLWQAFQLLTIVSVYCAIVHSLGHFVAALFLGVLIQFAILQILKISNLLAGAIAGAALAVGIGLGAAFVCGSFNALTILATMLLYPTLGYVIGMTSAAGEYQRTGY